MNKTQLTEGLAAHQGLLLARIITDQIGEFVDKRDRRRVKAVMLSTAEEWLSRFSGSEKRISIPAQTEILEAVVRIVLAAARDEMNKGDRV